MGGGHNRGLVQTVLGPVEPSALGPTTTHEHLHCDLSFLFRPARYTPSRELEDASITLENLGWVRRHYYSNHSNLRLSDVETAIREARMYREVGGRTIVDATTSGIGRDPDVLVRIARESRVHIVMGAGFYVDAKHPDDMDERSVEDLASEIVSDLTEGVGDTGVRAGIIGEVGCGWPMTANERKSLTASAVAQQETGAAILIHPGRNEGAPAEILGVLADGGADLSRVIMGHLDRTVFDFEVLRGIAESGCYMEWDLFGNEGSYHPQAEIDMPSDAQRLDLIKRIVDEGYGDRVVIAHDVFTKHRLVTYGGHGYGHILKNVVPTMRRKGFSDEQIEAITVRNPANVLTLA